MTKRAGWKRVVTAGTFLVLVGAPLVHAQPPPSDHIGRDVPDHDYHATNEDVDMATDDALVSAKLRQALTADPRLAAR
jgi:hypothetical protein